MRPELNATARPRDLEGKVALVIGGTRNIGAAVAEQIAGRGAITVLTYQHNAAAAEEIVGLLLQEGGKVETVRSDARDSTAVDDLFAEIIGRHARLDIVVHVAGANLKKPLAEVSDAEFDEVMDANTRSAFNTLRASARHLADSGRYVAVSTTLTALMAGPYGLYSASKAAVERLVVAAAMELAPRGITVNAVSPGAIDDDFFHRTETPDSVRAVVQFTPAGRRGTPADIAPVVGFLVSDNAAWVNGQTLRANGAMF